MWSSNAAVAREDRWQHSRAGAVAPSVCAYVTGRRQRHRHTWGMCVIGVATNDGMCVCIDPAM